MQSPLNIDEIIERYGLAEEAELKQQLVAFDDFIWQDCTIDNIEQLVSFEKDYQRFDKIFDWFYDSEIGEFGAVEMDNGPMSLLGRGRFQQYADGFYEKQSSQALMNAGLTDLEALLIQTFLADLSGLFRIDAYYHGVPPFVKSLRDTLDTALSKLSPYTVEVIRKYNEYDKSDFNIGDVFRPGYCLTASADPTWGDGTESLYHIKPLDGNHTKARAIFLVYDNSEMQVTFLQEAQFAITDIRESAEGKKEIWMKEFDEKR